MEKKKLSEVQLGDWFQSDGGEPFVRIERVLRDGSMWKAVSIRTGKVSYPVGGVDMSVNMLEKPDWALPLVDGEFRFKDEASSYELNETLNDMFPDVRITSERRPSGFFLCYKTTQAKKAEIRRTLGGS